ncbi:hypothetical protein F0342_03830 [Bacillus sp. CH30_1T]|uniref:hypothetical protein n=1 Tax=Rossellomorea aquimaris TaxID=189382 RepID=UPI0011EEFCD5|nr:hypothetical protein F0342_03830 [Bacillus sp. CH30_1T]
MRDGITCKACNQTKHSLNEYQRIRGDRCFSCGSKGEMKSGKDGYLYLITPGEQLPEIKPVDNSDKKRNKRLPNFL